MVWVVTTEIGLKKQSIHPFSAETEQGNEAACDAFLTSKFNVVLTD